jgi:hypothetical protein
MTYKEREEEEKKFRLHKQSAERLLPFIKACPHILRPETTIEMYVEELNEAATKIDKYLSETIAGMRDMLPYITACPQLFKPEIGIEEFVNKLEKAASKFNFYFH